jgi:hypothetical protein
MCMALHVSGEWWRSAAQIEDAVHVVAVQGRLLVSLGSVASIGGARPRRLIDGNGYSGHWTTHESNDVFTMLTSHGWFLP